jgi:transposase
MNHWNKPRIDREQFPLFAPTLDAFLDADHPVRMVDEILRSLDFGSWEQEYDQFTGQPPIHPRVLAGVLLYGLSLGIRSSRKLENACGNRMDFIWLAEGRQIDHSTFCNFRTGHGQQLKELFRKLVLTAREMGLVRLNQVTWDGTRIKANNSRHNTARHEKLEQLIKELDSQFDQLLKEAAATDAGEDRLFGEEGLSTPLPAKLAGKQKLREELKRAMEALKQMEADRGNRKDLCQKGPQMPLADTDSRVLPNKEGGYAPNYTPVLAVDAESGIVVDAVVLGGKNEDVALVPSLERIEQTFGERPKQALADSGFNTGSNLELLEDKQVEGLIAERQSFEENPARRPDPTQPVAEADREKLPMNPQAKVLDKAAFIYVAEKDCYFCPMGKELGPAGTRSYQRENCQGVYRVYQGKECGDCPLKSRCVPGKSEVRRIYQDEYDAVRKRAADRLGSEAGKKSYSRRWPVAEGRFGVIKSVMGVRQFLLRGMKKVGMEWTWTATAYNLRVMVRCQLEKKGAQMAMS